MDPPNTYPLGMAATSTTFLQQQTWIVRGMMQGNFFPPVHGGLFPGTDPKELDGHWIPAGQVVPTDTMSAVPPDTPGVSFPKTAESISPVNEIPGNPPLMLSIFEVPGAMTEVSSQGVFHNAKQSTFNQVNQEQLQKDQSNLYEDVSEPGDEENQTQVTAEDPRSTERAKVKEEEIIVKVHFLMHAFGDANNPLYKSFLLMHKLLESQMILLIRYCEHIVKLRKKKKITHEELLFLMRKNKALLRRLLQFLYIKDHGSHILPGFEEYRGTKIIPQEAKTVCNCLKFLSSIENFTGELSYLFCDKKVFDCVLQKRLERRYIIENSREISVRNLFKSTLAISLNDYVKDLQELTTFDITPIATWIIEFLALETVAGLVEKAIYLRSRKSEEKIFKFFPHLDFSCSKQFDDSDDDLLEDDAASPDVKFSIIPRKYLKEKNSFENNEKKISNDETFYQDSLLTVLPKVVLFPNDSKPKYLPKHFIQGSGHPPLNILMRNDTERELIPKNPITPDEIRAAFIHYQRPRPITVLMIPKPPYSEKRKTKLICLALPNEEFEEET